MKNMFDFQKDVIGRSHEIPVLVDFWAPWCGPCKVLGPVLDQLADENSQEWELVKINTEEEEELSRTFNIRSIPNVKLFHKGEVISEFMGALPKAQIETWLETNIPSASDKDVDAIMFNAALSLSEKARQLEAVLDVYPDKKNIKLATAMHSMFANPTRSMELIESFKLSDPAAATVQMIKDISQFMVFQNQGESPFDKTLEAAQNALKNEEWESGVKKMIDLVSIDKSYEHDMPRKTTIGIFQFLGPKHPVTIQYRKMFDMILW